MELGFSSKDIENLNNIIGVIGVLCIFLIFSIAHRRGINVNSLKFQLTVIATSIFVFFIIPDLLFTKSSFIYKLGTIILGSTVAFINFFVIDRIQKRIREKKK